MILSFHPCFAGDRYIHCAGRPLTEDEKNAMNRASAVILPQGCGPALYKAARTRCENVFPDFSTRFEYPGKKGQIELFRAKGIGHPDTILYPCVDDFTTAPQRAAQTLGYPLVFKFDQADEGQGVFRARTPDDLTALLGKARAWERTGQAGFLLQRYVPPFHGVLRVVVIYTQTIAYWRVADTGASFPINIAGGAAIDDRSHPDRR